MTGYGEWQLDVAVAATLEDLGWRADDHGVRDLMPAVIRGGNAIVVTPPAPAWADAVLAALLGAPAEADRGAILVLAAPAMVDEWVVALGALADASGRRIAVIRDSGRPGGSLESIGPGVIVASPDAAMAQHARSALHPERLRAVCFGWPEDWQSDSAVAAILSDCPAGAQRVVLTARPDLLTDSEGIASRYARKALAVRWPGSAPEAVAPPPPMRTIRTVPVTWSDRAGGAARAIEAAGLDQVTVWTANTRDHWLIRRAMAPLDPARVVCRDTAVAGPVVCYDPPPPADFRALLDAGDLILLVPPGTEGYVHRLAPEARPLPMSAAVSAVLGRDALARAVVARAVEQDEHAAALYALAPLFVEYDPQRVAAAIFDLWRAHQPQPDAATPAAGAGTVRVRVGAGKRDGATPGDFVAVLVKEVGLDRSRIGRIELHDTFSLVEVPQAEADGVARRLTGLTIRRRRLSARVDRGERR